MKAYTERMALLFDGFRIDNCHSTPIHVASYLLDAARTIRPDLYIIAELFTGNADMDVEFVRKLGIHSLIRESMAAWDPSEQSRFLHRYGGVPIGSMYGSGSISPTQFHPHALLMDCTHDNETPMQRRTAQDTLSNAALVAMASCAVGSVMGYDYLVPKHLNVVSESRLYATLNPATHGILAGSFSLTVI
jgi:glycogen debranching enzyme